ncbi:hypothetical protein Vretimale_13147, partial [Volvox reticuliferus]
NFLLFAVDDDNIYAHDQAKMHVAACGVDGVRLHSFTYICIRPYFAAGNKVISKARRRAAVKRRSPYANLRPQGPCHLHQVATALCCCFCLRFFLCLQALLLRTANADGFICIVADDADRTGICQGLDCGGLYPSMIRAAMEPKPAGDATGILVLGEFDDESPARRSLEGWVSAAGLSTSIITYVSDPAAVNSVNFSAYKLIYLPSSANGLLDFAGNSGFTNRLNDALTAVRDRLLQFLNAQGLAVREQKTPDRPSF